MHIISEDYGKTQAQSVITSLMGEDRWFQVEPLPFDIYRIAVKPEKPLPVPVGAGGLSFKDWGDLVNRHFDDCLTKEGKDDFRRYFLQGLTPMEAIYQDRADQEV